jgi:hypothetical protein
MRYIRTDMAYLIGHMMMNHWVLDFFSFHSVIFFYWIVNHIDLVHSKFDIINVMFSWWFIATSQLEKSNPPSGECHHESLNEESHKFCCSTWHVYVNKIFVLIFQPFQPFRPAPTYRGRGPRPGWESVSSNEKDPILVGKVDPFSDHAADSPSSCHFFPVSERQGHLSRPPCRAMLCLQQWLPDLVGCLLRSHLHPTRMATSIPTPPPFILMTLSKINLQSSLR